MLDGHQASFLVQRQARMRNDANHVRDGDYRLLFIQRRNNFERDTRVWRDTTKRKRGEKAEYTFSTRYSSNRFLPVSLSLFPPSSFVRWFLIPCIFFALPYFANSALRFTCGEPFGFPVIRRRWKSRVGNDFLLAVRVTLRKNSFSFLTHLSFVFFFFFTFDR